MAYKDTWWYPNHLEYMRGSEQKITWPNVMEQYRRPSPLYDLRRYKLPTEDNQDGLYYRLPTIGRPEYRGKFRDQPFCVPRYYPSMHHKGQPEGFYGRMYYEDLDHGFKYRGRHKDDLHWLNRPSCLKDQFVPR